MVDVPQAFEEVVRLISFDRRARNVDIRFSHTGAVPPTYAVRGQLQQVFINVSLNALDAMPEGGRLTVITEQVNGHICIRVRDTGEGIPEEAAAHIFEPFFTTKPPGQGTGLGLLVSRSIVEKHGGDLKFATTPGGGTEFVVQIPIRSEEPEDQDVWSNRTAGGR